MTDIKYPISVSSVSDKYAYLYRLQELLRLEHNENGRQFREKEITETQWINYQKDDFDPKSEQISNEICKYRELLKADTKNVAKLTDIINDTK